MFVNPNDIDYLKHEINFLKNEKIIFSCKDGVELYHENKEKNNILWLFDPPYLISHNSFYENVKKTTGENIYEYFSKIELKEIKPKVYFILEQNWITNLLFKNWYKKEYYKLYQISKKNTIHSIYSNIPIG